MNGARASRPTPAVRPFDRSLDRVAEIDRRAERVGPPGR
jgi:hypothetical protein